MRTSLDCLVCFIRQARGTGKLASDNPVVQRRLVDEAGRFLAKVDPELSPPENAVALYAMFSSILRVNDPFVRVKQESNVFALSIRDEMEKRIAAADDPLKAAIRVAIGANIIDYAAQHVFDVEQTMDNCLSQEFVIDDYPTLIRDLTEGRPGARLLYLCDNCGEPTMQTRVGEKDGRKLCIPCSEGWNSPPR